MAIGSVMHEFMGMMKEVIETMSNEDRDIMEPTEPVSMNGLNLDGPITMPFGIGAFAKGLMLKGEKSPNMVLQCREKPTVKLLKRVSAQLQVKLNKKLFFSFYLRTSRKVFF
jgi:hypothetical protein